MNIVIIGGGAAGASCAARLRRLNENAKITILEQTSEISIANCGLPYYVSGIISDRTNILVSSVQKFNTWFNVDVYLNTKVEKINTGEKFVLTENKKKFEYDYLVIATGASPIIPEFQGLDSRKTFIVRTLADADKIKNYIKDNNPKNAVVVGGGFIGIEIAENLNELGLKTTVIELNNQILPQVDTEIAFIAQKKMITNGINLVLSDGVQAFEAGNVILNSGKQVEYDLCVLAIGVKPETDLAHKAGLTTNRGIVVDKSLKTSNEYIFAAGDNIEAPDFVSGHNSLVPLAGPANRQGRIVADNIMGLNSTYKNTQGSSVIKIFDITVASCGNNEKQLKLKNIQYWKTYVFGNSHAGYYPKTTQILFKLLFSPQGYILGSQAIGKEGVEKRIDVIASIMRNGGTIQDMIDAELCYAPPYSSAKDPVNILGMNADNILRGFVKPAFIEDLQDSCIIDVRPETIFKMGTIENAINIPITELRNRLNNIPKDKKVILSCNTGYTSYVASRILIQNGFNNIYSFMGGYSLYKQIYELQKKSVSAS